MDDFVTDPEGHISDRQKPPVSPLELLSAAGPGNNVSIEDGLATDVHIADPDWSSGPEEQP